jgi:hypothetical protein
LDLEILISPGAHLLLILSALSFTGKNKMSNANQTDKDHPRCLFLVVIRRHC